MQSEHTDNERLLRSLQRLKIPTSSDAFISFEPICCTLGIRDTHPYNYEAAHIRVKGLREFILIDDGKRVHYRVLLEDGRLIKTLPLRTMLTLNYAGAK